ncbi:MAG: NCS1 family nucleobase:cation symporter-1 [Rhodothermales bacterium]|jgi:NCS1 family nucleobase:cation symporter-1
MSGKARIPNRSDIDAVAPLAPSPSLYNADLAPVLAHNRSWGTWNIAALWVGMAVCIPTYTLAASLISQGMTWTQALFTIMLGNLIVLVPMILNAHAGTRYGIPFPVLLRASFGTSGANIPALMRAMVACGWFGIQTWIGGSAIYTLHSVIFGFEPAGPADMMPIIGLSVGQFASFIFFWAINIAVILAGIDTIKWLETLAAPFLLAIGLGLLAWGINAGGGLGQILSAETVASVRGNSADAFSFWAVFWPSLTAMVGFWATLSLNIPDFTRYAYSQRDQVAGQLIGLPFTMTLFSFIGIAVTSATVIVFGEAVWDPVELLGRFESPIIVGFALFALTIATLSTNIAANVVSPANDFANLVPSKITFRRGGLITGVIGILIFPWKLYSDLGNYIFTWLIGYSSLLGAIGGVMLVDYYIIRRARLSVESLYRTDGRYSYGGSGFNWRALAALGIGILPNVPGFLAQATGGAISVPAFFSALYTYAWFVSLAISALAYLLLTRAYPPPEGSDPSPTPSQT